MAATETHLPIASTLNRLSGLRNASPVSQWLINPEHEQRAEHLVTSGLNQLIAGFNSISLDDPILQLPCLQHVRLLKQSLGEGGELPTLDRISARDYIHGLHSAVPAMYTGQRAADGQQVGEADKILTPSKETRPEALIVGTAVHLYERTVMQHLQREGVTGIVEDGKEPRKFKTDDVIYPLEEIALLMHAQAHIGESMEPELLRYFAAPVSTDDLFGGLGYRTAMEVRRAEEQFASYRLNHLFHENVEGFEGKTVEQIIASIMYYFPGKFPNSQSAFRNLLVDHEVQDPESIAKMMQLAEILYHQTWEEQVRKS